MKYLSSSTERHYTNNTTDRSLKLNKLKNPFLPVLAVYAICFFFRFIEYFYIQTDRSFWGEAFIHKLAGIAVLCVTVRAFSMRVQEIGFIKQGVLKRFLQGLIFGLAVFAVAYGVEYALAAAQSSKPVLQFYISSYAIDENIGKQTGLVFFVICILGNMINVVMEEGVFRGLFQKLLEQRYRFITSAVISSALFGVWHIIAPIRQFTESGSLGGMPANIAMLVTTSALVGFQFSLMSKMTGSLYMAMGAHFVNNTIVNMLHMVSNSGVDNLMFVRIATAQTLSFVVVLLVYIRKNSF